MMQDFTLGKLTRTRADGSRYWSYCLVWWEGGARRRRALGTTDRTEAEAMARAAWADVSQPGKLNTVGDIVEAYLASLDGQRDDKRKREAWKAAGPFWAALHPAVIDRAVSLSYPGWRARSINTARQELSLIRVALNWAAAGGHLAKVPKIILPPMPETSVGHLSKPEFKRFLQGCAAPHVRLFAMLAVTTGGRKSAILQAKWDQVDFPRSLLALNAEGRKQNGKYRATVPLNAHIMPALEEARRIASTDYIIEHRGVPLLDIKKGIGAAVKRSGINCHPHMFRHSAAVWMAEDRVPMAEIASFLGHRNMTVTVSTYARYNPDYLRGAANSLTW